jgi:hypothetical protein
MRLNMHLMINKVQQIFSEKLTNGLRIREIGKDEAANAAQNISRATVSVADEKIKTQPSIKASLSEAGKFACEFLRRCRASSKGDEQASCLLTESLLTAAAEISSHFGQEKADEFLTDILAYTERSLTEERLSGAICDFFGEFSQEVIKNIKNKGDNEVSDKLFQLTLFLNSGLDVLIDKENMLPKRQAEGRTPGLAFAINNFFSTDCTVSINKGSVIAKSFEYSNGTFVRIARRHSREGEWQDDGPGGPGYYCYVYSGDKLAVGELETTGALSKVADYLRTTIGNERASSYLETLAAEANVMEAIASSIAIVALENGDDPAIEYVRHLNGDLRNAITSVTLAQNGAIFEGWCFITPNKISATTEGTIHSGAIDIVEKGHRALDWGWDTNSGIRMVVAPKDLNELYSSLR